MPGAACRNCRVYRVLDDQSGACRPMSSRKELITDAWRMRAPAALASDLH
jgi:hypothetical protein